MQDTQTKSSSFFSINIERKNIFKIILVLYLVTFVFYLTHFQNSDVPLTNEKVMVDVPQSHMALYKMNIGEKTFYTVLDTLDNPSFLASYNKNNQNKLEKLLAGDFWDPKRCSQMQVLLSKDIILFTDIRVDEKGEYIANVYTYNKKENKLLSYKTKLNISKIYKDENSDTFYALATQENVYKLYKLDLSDKKFVFIKNIENKKGYNLITATTTLAFCESISGSCTYDKDYSFEIKDNLYRENKDFTSVYIVDTFLEKQKIFSLTKRDQVRYFNLGVD